jgi:prepilin-type N-terminal cleavage/methylation domain-containing protein
MTAPERYSGFTLTELMVAVVVLSLLTLMGWPQVQRVVASQRTSSAATIVAVDLEQAFTLASRQRRPVVLSCDCPNRRYQIADAATGAIYLARSMNDSAEVRIDSLAFSASPITVYPRGMASAPVTVTVQGGASNHQIALTTAGIVRITQ